MSFVSKLVIILCFHPLLGGYILLHLHLCTLAGRKTIKLETCSFTWELGKGSQLFSAKHVLFASYLCVYVGYIHCCISDSAVAPVAVVAWMIVLNSSTSYLWNIKFLLSFEDGVSYVTRSCEVVFKTGESLERFLLLRWCLKSRIFFPACWVIDICSGEGRVEGSS